jgi:hypothetical protein
VDFRNRVMPPIGSIVFATALVGLVDIRSSSAGFLDFFFGGFQQPAVPFGQRTPIQRPNRAELSTGVRPSVPYSGGYSSYCVRLCDGRYFPVDSTGAAEAICRGLCPATATKVFSGSEIIRATATDGSTYEKLATAFAFRDRIVPQCTCNGRDPFGTATMRIEDDPTMKAHDLIATERGPVPFRVWRKRHSFTPLEKRSPAL